MSGCANIWNPKSLRAAAGGHLKVPVKANVTWDVIHRVVPPHPQVSQGTMTEREDPIPFNSLY
jgi:hypothetical protein